MLEIVKFDSGVTGNNVLILGAIHGNETCGPKAIAHFLSEYQCGKHILKSGSVSFIAVCNPRAYVLGQRYVDVNLNRVISDLPADDRYETQLVKEITTAINKSDVLLDIHSYADGRRPFLFLDQNTEMLREFAKVLPFEDWVSGWPELYAENKELNSGDTVSYALQKNKNAILVECGQHEDPQAPILAYETIVNTLNFWGVLGKSKTIKTRNYKEYKVMHVFTRCHNAKFVKPWQHLDTVFNGAPLIIKENGDVLLAAPKDGAIILPDQNAAIGQEWLYFGEIV